MERITLTEATPTPVVTTETLILQYLAFFTLILVINDTIKSIRTK